MKKAALLSLLLTALVWLVFSWPLPAHVTTAIPGGSAKPPLDSAVQTMLPGDNLQLEYHFWLFGDMLAGRTPWFYNLYEFNTGDDKERYEPGSYYVPFSLFHAMGTCFAGRAFGWNLSGFLSLWFSALFTYLLVRRYTGQDAGAWLGAAAAIMLPYRWINLMGGSPTGLALMWVPVLFLGIDIAVRENRFRGGILAGLAIVGTAWGDAHTFFFAILATPCWCLVAFLQRERFDWKDPKGYIRIALALAPIIFFSAFAYVSSKTTTKQIGEASAGGGRTWAEVALFSPRASGFFSWKDLGVSNHVYIGMTTAILALAGLGLGLRARRVSWPWLLVLVGLAGVAILALGTNGPFHGRALAIARKLIPPYGMMRQPAKIYCLMPSLLAVAIGLTASCFTVPRRAAWILGALLLVEWRLQVQPIICRFDATQGAYEAVAKAEKDARALVIPLWPGDSHYASIYQHDASLYRVRMLNGYRPFVAKDYIETIFHGFESANLGVLSNAQLDELERRGTKFILLHEDLFPEKVSPFPVAFTLQNLLTNPRLEMIQRDRSVWAFRIVQRHIDETPPTSGWNTFFPARHIECESMKLAGAAKIEEAAASGGSFMRLDPGNRVYLQRDIATVRADGMRWLVRARGTGTVAADTGPGASPLVLATNAWTWLEVPVPPFDGLAPVRLGLACTEGSIDADVALLVAGEWRELQPGESLSLPAAEFFHAGRAVPETGGVEVRAGVDRKGLVLYGPRMPFAQGAYEISVEMATAAPENTQLGTWIVFYEGGKEIDQFLCKAGRPSTARVTVGSNLPLMLSYVTDGAADCEIRRITFKRLAD